MVEIAEASQIDVQIGDVSQSTVIIGDHATVQTPDGVQVIRIVEPAAMQSLPKPRLRERPLTIEPGDGRAPLGRDDQFALAAQASPGEPIQFCGPEGIGKSALVKQMARDARDGAFLSGRRRTLDDLGPMLFGAFWECDQPFVPAPADVPRYLADCNASIVVDDVDLDRDDVESLVDMAPRCTWVIASRERTLWGRGRATPLAGLSPETGAALIARELGRTLDGGERAAAETISSALAGHPQRLVEAAAIAAEGHATLEQMAQAPGGIRADAYALTDSQLRILAVLAAAPGAAVGTAHVAAVTNDPGAPAELEHLERLGWAKSASPRYRLVHELPGGAPEPPSAALMGRLTDYVAEGPPVADDAEAIEAALLHAVRAEDWEAGADLARAAERPLATAGLLGSWERVLHAGHHAASRSGHDGDTALFLHELGSRAMCLTRDEEAIDLLTKALEIRERIGDDRGAELTRHNLDQIRGGGVPPKKSGLRPNRPRPGIALAVLVVAVAALFGLLQVTGDDGDKPRTHPHRSAAKREATRAPAAPPTSTPPAPGHVRPPAGGPVVTPGTDGGSTGSGPAGSGSETGDSGSNDPAKVPPPG